MITLRNLCGLLFALALALSAGASFAADKQYVLTAASATATPQPAFTFTFTNEGNSSFNSLTLSLPSGWSISTAGGATASRGTATINSPARNVVSVQNINLPTGAGQSMTVTVTGVTGSSSTCGIGQSGGWTAQPWTGSSVGSGQKFNPKPGSTYPVPTSIPATCYAITASAGTGGSIAPSGTVNVAAGASQAFAVTPNATYRIADVKVDNVSVGAASTYTFSAINANHTIAATFALNTLAFTPPAIAYVNVPFNVSVAYDGPAPASVTVGWNCGPGATGSSSINAPSSTPVSVSVTLPKPGTCALTASAPNYQSFTASVANVYSGTLGCSFPDNKRGDLDPQALVTYVKASDQGKWGLIRGKNKPNSNECDPVPYTFELDVLATPQVSKFIVPNPQDTSQGVTAKYTVVWGRFDVNANGDNIWTTKRPNVSWGIANPVAGSTDYVPALACVLDPDNPDLAGTYPNGFTSVPTGDLDKLLPVIPNVAPFSTNPNPQYQPGQKAKMCIAQQGWTATGSDNPGDPLTGLPTTVQIWTSVIDQGDGFMNLP